MTELFSFYGMFQVVCFSLLVLALVKLFFKYGKTSIIQSIQQKKEQLLRVKEAIILCQYERDVLKKEREQQKQKAKELLKKIKQWHHVEQEKYKKLEIQREASQKRVHDYVQDQAGWFSIAQAKKRVMPEALQETEKKLFNLFSNKNEQKEFLDRVIFSLKERV